MISRATAVAQSINEHCSTMTNTAMRNSRLETHTAANWSANVRATEDAVSIAQVMFI